MADPHVYDEILPERNIFTRRRLAFLSAGISTILVGAITGLAVGIPLSSQKSDTIKQASDLLLKFPLIDG